jgi:putative ABC transport system permease protein
LTSLRDTLVNPQREALTLMLAAVLTFLLLACSNVAALLATRASLRQREHAVRSALGATRAVLLRQSALEACLLSAVGGALGLGLAQLGMRLANHQYHDVFANLPVRLDPHVSAAFLGLLLLSALTATLAPVLHARGVRPMDALRGDGRSSQSLRERRVREGLVALQVAASLALLVNAGLLVRSVRALLAVDLGFSTSGVVAAALLAPLHARGSGPEFQTGGLPVHDLAEQRAIEARGAEALAIVQSVVQRVQQLPGVETACVASELPFDWFSDRLVMDPEEASGRDPQPAQPHDLSPGCLATLGIRLLSGRDFTASDGLNPESVPVALVNQQFAHTVLGLEDAVGHRFRRARPPDFPGLKEPWIEIIGMVGDALEDDVTAPRQPAVYLPFFGHTLANSTPSSVNFAVAVKTSGSVEPLLRALPKAISEVVRHAPVFTVERLSERVERSFSDHSALECILCVFGLCALILAAIGLFGVTAYSVSERASEIGIRRALGATHGAIVRMILGETALVVGAGMVLGIGLCWLGRGLLAAFLFDVAASDAVTYLCVCLGISGVALTAALVASRAAFAISPSRALARR